MVVCGHLIPQLKGTITTGKGIARTRQSVWLSGQRMSALPQTDRVPCCQLWHVWLYHVFAHYVIDDMTLKKKILTIKCLFLISPQLLSKTFLNLRRNQQDRRTSASKVLNTPVRF
jgi:hypothetical protein